MTVFEGFFTAASSLRVAIVVARFNDLVTGKLLSGCLDALTRRDAVETLRRIRSAIERAAPRHRA